MAVKDLILYGEYPDFPTKGVNFIDLTPSLLDPNNAEEIVKQLMKLHINNENEVASSVDYIISPDARGFIWGGMVAQKYNLGFIPVRKVGKLPDGAILSMINYQTEYSSTELCLPIVDISGKRLLFIDDVYATGGTYMAIKELVNQNNGILIGGSVLVDVELDQNPEVKSLVKVRDLKKGF